MPNTTTTAPKRQRPAAKAVEAKSEPLDGPEIVETPGFVKPSAPVADPTQVPHTWNGTTWVPVQQSQPNMNQAPQYTNQVQAQPQQKDFEPDYFYVFNVTPGPHMITDTPKDVPHISIDAFKVHDLTYYPASVKNSLGLHTSLTQGILKRVTREKAEEINARGIEWAKMDAQNKKAEDRERKLTVNGKQYQADILDLNRGGRPGKNSQSITTEGNINDPVTYANVLSQVEAEAAARNMPFDAITYGRAVAKAGKFLSAKAGLPDDMMFRNGSVSGTTRKSSYTVAVAPGGTGSNPGNWSQTGVAQGVMTNFNRDQYVAGSGEMGINTVYSEVDNFYMGEGFEEDAYAEEIDLNDESEGRSGGFRPLH